MVPMQVFLSDQSIYGQSLKSTTSTDKREEEECEGGGTLLGLF